MLFRQDFRRSHQASLVPVFHRLGQGQHGQSRLAATHVPLHQPVHRFRTLHIVVNLLPGLFLAVRQCKAQLAAHPVHQLSAAGHLDAPAVPLDFHPVVQQAALQEEQFLKNEPLPGLFQQLLAFGKMDVLQGLQPGQEMFGPQQRCRQAFRKLLPGQCQGLPYSAAHIVLGQTAGQGIGGQDARSLRLLILHMGQTGRRDAFGRASQVHLTDDEYLIPRMVHPGHVSLSPEQDDFCKSGTIPHRNGGIFHVPHAPPVVQPHDGSPEQLHGAVRGQFVNGLYMGIIQVASLPGKMVQQIADGHNVDVFKFQGLFGPDAFEFGNWFLPPHVEFLLFS